ncbi:putative calmodulin [Neospora caninum Liverpool]|uniref:Calmodulin, putative n=1 Tax=Neospora caninum (strain Liverpool) TaxID=572307 RepID=F0VQD7_NEOCL|nr:putative calmodulin [Neospora caninum Liverpool]CBZ55934.1 putative calmodulin [Neospora caninum Liverpool]CEL70677.1 TPA: calmodulin, putative [Neospora caninum Liverpool]|eukprot:XP_003885960.1 putative calmodulin [Neospora caninum Liverpool]
MPPKGQSSSSGARSGKNEASPVQMPQRLRAHAAELERIFTRIDADGDGKLSEADVTAFMKDRVGFPLEADQVKALLVELRGPGAAVDSAKGSSPPIDFPTFLAFVDTQLMKPVPDLLREVFQYIDTDKDGKLTARELQAFAQRLSLNLSEDGAANLLNRGHNETSATFEEFCGLVQTSLPSVGR